VSLLLDTCALYVIAEDPRRLSAKARSALLRHRGSLLVSAISAFEVAIKVRKGGVVLPLPAWEWYQSLVASFELIEVPISAQIAARSVELPYGNQDPCDRMILATAIERGCTVLTSDGLMAANPLITTLW
jgi:PIN domain nuclease of toxin-antitoxin system